MKIAIILSCVFFSFAFAIRDVYQQFRFAQLSGVWIEVFSEVGITLKEIKVSGKTAKICPKNNRSKGVILRANYGNDNNL